MNTVITKSKSLGYLTSKCNKHSSLVQHNIEIHPINKLPKPSVMKITSAKIEEYASAKTPEL